MHNFFPIVQMLYISPGGRSHGVFLFMGVVLDLRNVYGVKYEKINQHNSNWSHCF